jgi:hypothetical protein
MMNVARLSYLVGPWLLAASLLLLGCGRYFPGPLRPTDHQTEGMTVNDDGSVTFALDRLEVTLKPMTDAELNRQFASASVGGGASVNPYTFGDWTELGDEFTPPRFTVFRLQVGNYQFPKVLLDPLKTHITTANNRRYGPVTYAQLYDYYRTYWQGRTGRGRVGFRNRTDILKRTMYPGEIVFSGRDEEGYLVFPVLHDDVTDLRVSIADIAVRFNYADIPVESIDLSFSFQRNISQGFTPTDAVQRN